MGAYTHLPFPHVQGGIENSPLAPLSSHTPLYDISFFLSSIGRGHPILFFFQPAGQAQREQKD